MIAHVALPYPLSRPFSYNVPSKWENYLFESQRVLVPFGEKKIRGFIVSLEDGNDPQLKEIIEPIDLFPIITPPLLKLIYWIKDTFIIPIGVILKYALSNALNLEDFLLIRTEAYPEIEGLSLKKAYQIHGREKIFSFFSSGKIELRDIFFGDRFPLPEAENVKGEINGFLNVSPFEKRIRNYLSEIEKTLRQDQSCLFLVPPYNLSGRQIYELLSASCPGRVFWLGKETKSKERMKIYFALNSHSGYVVLSNVIGLFLPIRRLGLVIIERPEDESFVVDSRFSINVADSAMKRSEIEEVSLIVGSVAPPFSTIRASRKLLLLKENINSFDLQVEKEQGEKSDFANIVGQLYQAIKRKESVAIFVPRKYYGGRIKCMECKRILSCSKCGTKLSFSKKIEAFFCPECEASYRADLRCPSCGSPYVALGLIGSEFIVDLIKQNFPKVDVHLVTSESLSEENLETLEKKGKDESFILVGTNVLSFMYKIRVDNLFVVASKELKKIWKYRAYEKFYQTVMNLVDSLKPKRLLILGAKKDDLEVQYLLEPERFYAEELKKREEIGFPPYNRLVLIQLSRNDKTKLEMAKKNLENRLKTYGLEPYIFGHRISRHKKGFVLKMILVGLTEENAYKLFPLFDLYGVTIRVDPDVI